jgi:environmental stress-induced protein Ves
VTLKFQEKEVGLKKDDSPLFFPGEAFIHCSLISGPVRDFNIMIRRNWGKAFVEKVSSHLIRSENELTLIYDLKSLALWELAAGEELFIESGIVVKVTPERG